jgi:ElaB/YqjD/DUF883 family membrane-anchored ribosome-binding protein
MPKTNRPVRVADKAEGLREKAHHLVEQSQEALEAVTTRAVDAQEQAIAKGHALLERVADQVRANPIRSVLVAFGVGYLGTRLIRR